MQLILGISCFYHDSAACLLRDGNIIAAAQQERFSRIKHDAGFPADAIRYCLAEAGVSLADISAIVYYDKPLLKFERLLETFLAHAPRGFAAFVRAMPVWLKEKLYLKAVLRRELRLLAPDSKAPLPRLLFSQHHQAHAASAFYPSPFQQAVVICLDGVGEWVTSSIWLGQGNSLTPLHEIHFPHSLGLLYSAFTQYCGFKVNSGEYKLMGLAPYGEPRYVDIIYRELIDVKADGSFSLNMRYFDYPVGQRMINRRFEALFGGPALAFDAPPQQLHLDLACSVQQVVEQVVLKIVRAATAATGCSKVCLAGGVALNCVVNGRLLAEQACEALWIQPAAGDAGGALGAALLAWHQFYQQPRQADGQHDSMQGAQLGPAFTDADIVAELDARQLPYQQLAADHKNDQIATLLASGAVVGCFQGRMEFGPRALGNRSILADARSSEMQRLLNLKIKQRESFRPFAPAVMAEHAAQYFDLSQPSPYMLLVAQLSAAQRLAITQHSQGLAQREQLRSTLPAITHVDYSARLQTVDQQQQPAFYALLQAFYRLTGTPVLINTSFNVRGEPPVCTPADAIEGFLATDMDYLLLENCLLSKAEQPAAAIAAARQRQFTPD
ncbi:carbamoyltransferase family protein [Rheinheimera maricola]|uniref:Carbamoyltransferase n=1 Tax=Rheinheimera maricola TaxID=2793282 RepID=A0ABS7XCV1_9GAMM|nr:carbamoyltransferase [Rheinheimera maricola]MBZ9613384.1 carbamoyltransferase [Rheinheimera maricola]